VQFGIGFANAAFASPEASAGLAGAAEAAGFESLWTVEHVVVPAGYRSTYPYSRSGRMAGGAEDFAIPDPLVWLASLIGRTDRIRLATGVMILPLRNPVVLAKETATLDHLSGGRLILGVGSGWLAEEFAAVGADFERRGEVVDDTIRALRTLWGHERASHHGPSASFSDVYLRPQPAAGSIPIVVGGHSRRAARRAGELGDGFFPGRGSEGEVLDLFAHARRSAEAAGRDPDALELTVGARPDRESAERWVEAGAHRVVITAGSIEDVVRYGDEVIRPLRGPA
jgi:probable F420-dependent oxidoreductase